MPGPSTLLSPPGGPDRPVASGIAWTPDIAVLETHRGNAAVRVNARLSGLSPLEDSLADETVEFQAGRFSRNAEHVDDIRGSDNRPQPP